MEIVVVTSHDLPLKVNSKKELIREKESPEKELWETRWNHEEFITSPPWSEYNSFYILTRTGILLFINNFTPARRDK